MKKALVTGASGFIGSNVARVLVQAGYSVRVLLRKGADEQALAGLPVERAYGDILSQESLLPALQDCEQVYHVAALYTFWAKDPSLIYKTNVDGTRNILSAAKAAGAERIVYTSSVATLAQGPNGAPGHEETPAKFDELVSDYKRSKWLGEQAALEAADSGLPVVIVNPSTPVGINDWKPTPTGRIVLDFLHGGFPAYVDTGLNIVDVEDVAAGHLLAAEKGQTGRRYILGNHNMTMLEILNTLAEISGKRAPRFKAPLWLALLFSYFDSGLARLQGNRVPAATPETARLARKYMFYDCSRAVKELGMPQTEPREALRKAVEWFQQNGMA